MQRAILLLLALVACANAQIFQQNYDYRNTLEYVPAVPGALEGEIPFAGALRYLPPQEFTDAIRVSNVYTQTVRPANNYIVAIDGRSGGFAETRVSVDTNYLIVAAVSETSTYREGDVIIVEAGKLPGLNFNTVCYGSGYAMKLNSPIPANYLGSDTNGVQVPGTVSCLISESYIVAKLNYKAHHSEAAPLGFQNFKFVRGDRTIFGPTVFGKSIAL
jgi:hypothetical protein